MKPRSPRPGEPSADPPASSRPARPPGARPPVPAPAAGPEPGPVALPIVCAVSCLAAAAILGLLARTPAWTRADLRLADLVHELRHPWLTAVAEAFRVAFLPPAVIAVCAVTVILLLLARRYGGAVLTALLMTACWSTNSVYKALFDRPRPAPERQLVPELGQDGFPSGHVAVTLALAIAWCLLSIGSRRFRRAVAAGAVLVATQAFARVYLGAHHPTDVVGALLVAGAAATAVIVLCGPLAARLDRAAPPGRAPGRGTGQAGPVPPHGS